MFQKIYQILYESFGPQSWWPGETQFEVIIGATPRMKPTLLFIVVISEISFASRR